MNMTKIIRKHAWKGGPPVKGSFIRNEKGGLMGTHNCSRCNTVVKLRWHDETGYICERCFTGAVDCSVEGCQQIAVEDGLCRAHYLGPDSVEPIHGYSMIVECEGSW